MDEKLYILLAEGSNVKALTKFLNVAFHQRAKAEGWAPWFYSEGQILAMLSSPQNFYKSFTIPKKSGGQRRIDAPCSTLKMIQWALVPVFAEMFSPTDQSYGFIKGRGIVENARVHLGQDVVLNVDIEGFFPSISEGRLSSLFRAGHALRMSAYMARGIARLCTLSGALPQGSPASPVLTNMVAVRLDARLTGLANRFGCRYSRYVDDITFSSQGLGASQSLMPSLEKIMKGEGFGLNPGKTRIQLNSMRQEVTGLILSHSSSGVTELVNSPRKQRRQVRAMLHVWREKGILKAAEQNHFEGEESGLDFLRQLQGKVAHLRHVNKSQEVERYHTQLKELMKRDIA